MNIRKKIGPVVSATGIFILVVVGAMCYIFVWNGDLLQVNAMWIILASAVPSFIIFVVGVLLRVPPQGAGKSVHPGDEPQSLTASSIGTDRVVDSASRDERETDENWELPDLDIMRKYYDNYSPVTAADILKAIPQAYASWCKEGGRWGPGIVARFCSITSTTVGRYLKAFKKAGLREIDGIEIP